LYLSFERPYSLFVCLLACIWGGLLLQFFWINMCFAGFPCAVLRLFSKSRSWLLGLVQPKLFAEKPLCGGCYLVQRTLVRPCATSILNR
jgi:hypothetical protein